MIETPGQRLSRRFWTAVLVILVVAGLDWIGRPLAVAVVAAAVLAWAGLVFVRAARRGQRR